VQRFIVLSALALIGVFAAQAAASGPLRVKDPFHFEWVDDWTCPGTEITVVADGSDNIGEWDGRFMDHVIAVATLTANGKTLTNSTSATYLFNEREGTLKIAGTLYNVQVPGEGVVLLDAGVVIFNTETGELVREAGPHMQFHGDVSGLCSYFAAGN
jgi:hypothetical protein